MSAINTIRPCRHIKNSLGRYLDGELKGIWLAYVNSHVARCPQCQRALEALKKYASALVTVRTMPPEEGGKIDWESVERGWDGVDRPG